MSVKVRELKDDALISITVNKNFYLMLKAVMLYIFKQEPDTTKYEALIKKVTESIKNDEPHTEHEAAFKTMIILLAEIERRAVELEMYDTKEFSVEDEQKNESSTPN